MKKILSLAVVAAALCVSVGCEEKKSTGVGGVKSPTPVVPTSTKTGT
jgi:hypothetical protein